jgi:hypothetical protein
MGIEIVKLALNLTCVQILISEAPKQYPLKVQVHP